MAKRSDFAQKLLDDLRLRKERMNNVSQKSSQSHQLPLDAYAYSKQTHRGSRSVKAYENVSSTTSRSQRSAKVGEVSSNQIVPYGRDNQTQGLVHHMGDNMSLALAFAFENGGKLRRNDSSFSASIMGFHTQLKNSTMNIGKMERRQGNSEMQLSLSPIQINEIYKNAQRLNQILRASSNGFTIDRHSIEFAKELFQGAMNLEESLRMLVNLQKNSEFTVTTQKKNRIILLEGEDDDDDDGDGDDKRIIEQKQLARPIFSFDKPSKNSGNFRRNDHKSNTTSFMERQNSLGHSKGRKVSNEKQEGVMNTSRSVSHKRSKSCTSSADMKDFNAISEKSRIPNVIAKLMGLDNLPDKVGEKNTPQKKDSGMTMKQTSNGNAKNIELKSKQTENLLPQKKQKVMEAIVVPDYDAAKLNIMRESGRKQDKFNNMVVTQMEQQVHQRPEVKSSSLHEEKKQTNVSILEKKQANKNILSNPKGFLQNQNNFGVQKSNMEKHHREQKMVQGRSQRGSEITSKNSSKYSHEPVDSQRKQILKSHVTSVKHNSAENGNALDLRRSSLSHYDDLIRDEDSNDLNVEVKERMNKKGDQKSEQAKGRNGIRKVMDEKSVHKVAEKKVKSTRKQKIDEVATGRNGTMLHITKQVKEHRPILQQVKEITSGKFNVSKETEKERFSMFPNEEVAIIKGDELPHTLYGPDSEELQSPQEPVALVPNDLHQDVKSVATGDLKNHRTLVAADEEFKTSETATYTINGVHEDRMDTDSHLQQQQDQKNSAESPKPLTKRENRLKLNLVKSQLFLNTAESLFRFNMPISIVQCGSHENQDLLDSSNLLLDCGYEVMKRKGIRKELKVHDPCSKISISSIRIRSLDDLVRHLDEDMEKLKFYGRSRISRVNNNVEDYLPKMLENDVYNKDPDINCMWELGWNQETFGFIEKYDAVRNMEKYVLNGLLDEIIEELLNFQGGLNQKLRC